MEKLLKDRFNRMIEEKTMVEGVVRLAEYRAEAQADVVMVEVFGEPVYISRNELEANEENNAPLGHYIGKTLRFQIKEIDENGVLFGTAKEARMEDMRNLVERMKAEGKVKAKIMRLIRFGALVDINGIPALLRNQGFSEDYQTVADVYKEGDEIQVSLDYMSNKGRLYVKAKAPASTGSKLTFDELKPSQVVLGTVRNVKVFGAFVRVAPNVDALANIPETETIQEGDQVVFLITQVIQPAQKEDENGEKLFDEDGNPVMDRGKVRGKIQRVRPRVRA